MKNLLTLAFFLFAIDSFAAATEVDVISAEFGVEDHQQNKTLCLTVVRVPQKGVLLGVVEDIYDCTYARAAKKSPDHKIKMDLKKLRVFEHRELHQYLQTLDTQLKFYFSDGE